MTSSYLLTDSSAYIHQMHLSNCVVALVYPDGCPSLSWKLHKCKQILLWKECFFGGGESPKSGCNILIDRILQRKCSFLAEKSKNMRLFFVNFS